ncbi:MFS transporter [Clostridium formicaceticum]|uniref:Bacilysin exporter BacE n=1 Tax=Clostridium formicaceticum TaxID=1497 RepID=A0AAC9RKU3_9CLOT|nr:MFS transporter [Clostridium formicaceticum]AOY77011.1 hypothetical protein BJL90_14795 [Clostridium formicaceticum]ARE87502.1 Putative bacilysin exporter BacE [Clostridium formicaceticum]
MLHKLFLNKNFFLLWTGQMVSQIGDKFYGIALAWWILQQTNSPVIMGLFMAVSVLPGLAFGVFAGVFIDRWNRKILIIASDMLRGICVIVIAFLSVIDILELWHIFAAAILISLASAFFDPTVKAVIPQIVEQEQLPRANALSEIIDASSMIIGPVLGAAFVSFFGFTLVFLINGLSYLISAFFEGFITIPPQVDSPSADYTLRHEIETGIRYLLSRRKLVVTIGVIGIAHIFVGALIVSLPFLAKALSGDSIQTLGNLEMMIGFGMLLGALSIQLRGKSHFKDKNLFVFIAAMGIFYLAIAITKSITSTFVLPYMLLLLLIGAAIANASVYWQSILQLNTSSDMAGRVFSISSVVGNISLPISYGLFGILLKYTSILRLMLFSGSALLFISIVLMYFYHYGDKESQDNSLI